MGEGEGRGCDLVPTVAGLGVVVPAPPTGLRLPVVGGLMVYSMIAILQPGHCRLLLTPAARAGHPLDSRSLAPITY